MKKLAEKIYETYGIDTYDMCLLIAMAIFLVYHPLGLLIGML